MKKLLLHFNSILRGIGLLIPFCVYPQDTPLITFYNNLTTLHKALPAPAIWHERFDFFQDIMGEDEQQFVKRYIENPASIRHAIRFDGMHFFIKNSLLGAEYQAGFFEQRTIIELWQSQQEKLHQLIKTGSHHSGRFSVIEAINPQGQPFSRFVDVGALQADPQWHDAVFQVASNFSTLEPTGPGHYPEAGITGYIHDKTQGPFASISAAPGLIYRMYYIFYNPHTEPATWRQTRNHQINLLEKTSIPVTNGYIVFNDEYLKDTHIDAEYNNIAVGYHGDIEVTFGYVQGENQEVIQRPQRISQVFTAAVDFGSTNYRFRNHPQAIAVAKKVLEAAYEGTLYAAITHGKKKVVLTLIGGGVFGNDISWIVKVITEMQNFIILSGLEVTLIIYNSAPFTQFAPIREQLLKMVGKSEGEYVQYSVQAPLGKKLYKQNKPE